ncbi:hypothetical protein CALCODRAFT_494704 [Calocera cornea HHB12733]|uniref:BRCT domain-containing protein n=1 Tax=Calocera cornea HHB12733 TaxID=1353952 RepID=A0A165GXA5_9BASI|nr:hypothetical protein CALCODRAFT_494704 [Calocera cornea HHB12733]
MPKSQKRNATAHVATKADLAVQAPVLAAHNPRPDDDGSIFIEPMMGGPLACWVDRDVLDAQKVIDLIMKHGGQVSSGYSNVNYIIVNAASESGRNLARQYAGKKGKVVLSSAWVSECIRRGELLTFKSDWAGCRLDGTDRPQTAAGILSAAAARPEPVSPAPRGKKRPRPSDSDALAPPPPPPPPSQPQPQPHPHPPALSTSPSLTGPAYPLPISQIANAPHLWAVQPAPIAQQHHLPVPGALVPPHPHPHPHPHAQQMQQQQQQQQRLPPGYPAPQQQPQQMQPQALRPWEASFAPPPGGYGFHYPGAEHWDENAYYQHPFQPPPPNAYPTEEPYVGQAFTTPPSDAPEQDAPAPDPAERGRPIHRASRTSTSRQSIAQAGASRNMRKPVVRSPTPPTRIMKSTFGGNLFTSEDILYLKKYIDYCQQQGLILSLREICERLAIRAPHHTFYSWRRFCNKHQIKLGAYDMSVFKAHVDGEEGVGAGEGLGLGLADDLADEDLQLHLPGEADEPDPDEDDEEEDDEVRNAILGVGAAPGLLATPPRGRAVQAPAAAGYVQPLAGDRSPTPPKTLYRSTTGKGVAFTEEDVRYLLRYLQYAQGQDMVQVWRDIAQKAPHHSRASWMKYWRRHKHEFDTDRPPTLPQAGPDEPAMKRRRYDREDDVKLARLMLGKPQGTSDQIFQAFALLQENAHHPWKGWQEHHRIHKAKIDHIMQEMEQGVFKETV